MVNTLTDKQKRGLLDISIPCHVCGDIDRANRPDKGRDCSICDGIGIVYPFRIPCDYCGLIDAKGRRSLLGKVWSHDDDFFAGKPPDTNCSCCEGLGYWLVDVHLENVLQVSTQVGISVRVNVDGDGGGFSVASYKSNAAFEDEQISELGGGYPFPTYSVLSAAVDALLLAYKARRLT